MNKNVNACIELTGPNNPDAETVAEDTARLLIEVHDLRRSVSVDQINAASNDVGSTGGMVNVCPNY